MKTDKVLVVSADVPWPADGGGRIASLRVIEAIAESRIVDLVALADPATNIDLSHLKTICRRVETVEQPFTFRQHRARQSLLAARSMLRREPYRLLKFRSRAMVQRIAEMKRAESYRLIHHEQFGVAQYVDDRLPSTLTTQNVESQIYELGTAAARGIAGRIWSQLEARKLRSAEKRLYTKFNTVFALSDKDASALVSLGVRSPIVLPIPVAPIGDVPPSPPPTQDIITLGSMSWFGVEDGLIWFRDHVYPHVKSLLPHLQWHLVGANPSRRIQRLAEPGAITVHGYVADLEPLLKRARVCVVPLHIAGGVRIKLLEMLARGMPCVATSVGAQGLSFRDGEGCYRRDTSDDFARAVIRLLCDDPTWLQVTRSGLEYVRRTHTRSAIVEAVERGLQGAMRGHVQRSTERKDL